MRTHPSKISLNIWNHNFLTSKDKTFVCFLKATAPGQNALWSKVASWPCEWEGGPVPLWSSHREGLCWILTIEIRRKSLTLWTQWKVGNILAFKIPHHIGKIRGKRPPPHLEVPVFLSLYMWEDTPGKPYPECLGSIDKMYNGSDGVGIASGEVEEMHNIYNYIYLIVYTDYIYIHTQSLYMNYIWIDLYVYF